jgi:hypothetical protein
MEIEKIFWLIEEVPAEKREATLNHMGWKIGDIKAYHVTTSENAANILKNGFVARSSRQSYDRPAAVYFSMELDEINNANKTTLLDDPSDAEIIEVIIPRNEFLKYARYDGLYNASFGTSRSAMQFFSNVPAEWIVK